MATVMTEKPKTAPEAAIAVCEGVSRVYRVGGEDVYAVREVSCEIRAGQLVALRGRSGSGKTTLLNILSGLDRPTHGRTLIRGEDTRKLSDRQLTELRRHDIGFIFQAFALLPVLSAYENVELPLRIAGVGARQRQRRATELLELVGLAKRNLDGKLNFLWGLGWIQLVGMADSWVSGLAMRVETRCSRSWSTTSPARCRTPRLQTISCRWRRTCLTW